VTVNSPIPMQRFEDGPRTARGIIDAAIDQRPYQLDLTVTGSGTGELLFRADLRCKNGYLIRFDSKNAILFRFVGGVRTQIISAAAPLGAYSLVVAGSQFTLKKPDATVVWDVTDTAVQTGLRLRYSVGLQSWTTVGKLL
jgi:hypothetical protein